MKRDIHPQWHPEAQVLCACGNTFTVGSTKAEIRVETCNRCHPYFTGKMKFLSGKSKVERFEKQRKQAVEMKTVLDAKKKEKLAHSIARENAPKTLREMLLGLR